MTTNQTIDGVPRELLEYAVALIDKAGQRGNVSNELRALLDGPERDYVLINKMYFSYAEILEWREKACEETEKYDQSQGEPVAELQVAFFEHGPMATINWFTPSAFEPGATKLYAEQPAPVAVK